MARQYFNNVGYSLNQGPLTGLSARPIVASRVPTGNDTGFQPGTLWLYNSNVYCLANTANGSATWNLLSASGGSGSFASLTVTPGPISLTGTTTINTSGAATTAIATGGTGAVTLGNATGGVEITGGTSVTGTFSCSSVATLGSAIALTAGGALYVNLGTNILAPQILVGSGAPTASAAIGSLYLRSDGSTDVTRMYVATSSAGTWTAVNTVA